MALNDLFCADVLLITHSLTHSYVSRVLTHYVPNFLAMATRVARGKIRVASFDGLSPKTPL